MKCIDYALFNISTVVDWDNDLNPSNYCSTLKQHAQMLSLKSLLSFFNPIKTHIKLTYLWQISTKQKDEISPTHLKEPEFEVSHMVFSNK